MTGNDTQQRLTAFIGRETEYWDFWGTIRIVKNGTKIWLTKAGGCILQNNNSQIPDRQL